MKGLKAYLIVGSLLIVLYITAQLNRPKVVDWTPTLDCTQKIPFGDYIIFQRIGDIFPGSEIMPFGRSVYNVLADEPLSNTSYIIIADNVEPGKPDYDELVNYIKKGNDIFIAANNFGKIFKKNLHIETSDEGDTTAKAHFLNPTLDTARFYSVGKTVGSNSFYSFDTSKTVVLGKDKLQKANFIKLQFGKGSLYLCSNPLFFSNYSMLQPDGQKYAARALSFVKNTRKIAWDEYYTQGSGNDGSLFRVFFDHPPLLWAYYITFFSLLSFVLYEIKRRQRIIPVLDPLENSTLSFVTTVGQVYFEKRDNGDITRKMIIYFLEQVRVQYHLKTNPLDEEFIDNLSKKTGVDIQFVTMLVNLINQLIKQAYISDQQLIELNKLIEQFYTKSR
jgi:hypothetical protein